METFSKLFYLLSYKERINAFLLFILILINAILDTIGVASILPFMAVLSNPDIVETNQILNFFFHSSAFFGVENTQQFLFLLGFMLFILLIFSLSIKAVTVYYQSRFVLMRQYSIGKLLIERYLHQPYSWFLSRNSAELGKNILTEVSQIVGGIINPLIELMAKGLVTICLITLLFLVDPKLTLIVGLTIGSTYLLIFNSLRKYITKIGNKRLINNNLRFIAVNEAFGAIKEIKIKSLEHSYVKLFSKSAKILAKTQAYSNAVSQLPRFILESIAFGGILLIILYLMSKSNGVSSVLPVVSLYVFSGYRLIPALQKIYSCFVSLTFSDPSLNKIYDDIKNLKTVKDDHFKDVISFNNKITLKNIFYEYPNSSRTALKNINLEIYAKSSVGFVGATGSGKTTMVDIILGLLEPQKGTLEVDGKVITSNKNIRAWQKLIGYVPQNIFLSDDSISANIAFGVETKDVKEELIEKASRIANLHDFVVNELPEKYQTTIGERGIRLSGGQIQRIGIARALYHNPKILILDEATSSLDNLTEQMVMDDINNLSKNITIIQIAHRLNTVKNCDIIYEFNKGQLVGQKSYEKLIEGIDSLIQSKRES